MDDREIFVSFEHDTQAASIFEKEALYNDSEKGKSRSSAKNICCVYVAAGIGAWALAERLEAAVLRFESRLSPRSKAGFEFELSPSDECLYRAFLTGQHVPRTQRRLYDLVT